jgi:hypothetical protein
MYVCVYVCNDDDDVAGGADIQALCSLQRAVNDAPSAFDVCEKERERVRACTKQTASHASSMRKEIDFGSTINVTLFTL